MLDNWCVKTFTIRCAPLFLVIIEKSYPHALAVPWSGFRSLNTSTDCAHNLLCTRLMRSRSMSRWLSLWFLAMRIDLTRAIDSLISGVIFIAHFCTFSILSLSCLKCGDQNCTTNSRCGRIKDLCSGRIISLFLYLKCRLIVFVCLSVCFCPVLCLLF